MGEILFLSVFLLFCLFLFLWIFGNYHVWRLPKSRKYARILMYHSVSNERQSGMNINPNKFESHIKYLIKKKYKFVKISNLKEVNLLRGEKIVALTLDDGFENNYTEAFQILKKYNARATIYISSNIKDINKLKDEQIEKMIESGLIEIGSHTMNHVNLNTLSRNESKNEILSEVDFLEDKFNIECKSFAYPFGRFTDRDIEILKEIGIESGLTTKKELFNLKDGDFFRIPRIGISGKINILQFNIAITRGRYKF